ncbi:hypothetical protein HELRODRAFT_62927 [Helobdella robusta]|uniref:N-acyl-aliphatic-L-amino acid amidohydrolase n=1 Tax=Helobdella robusta TaxID=6412 RepID=T1FX79_HELRO|nr:hypothetical protein HELRODRAFT_62927 [Helobdella robusta]ESO12051.1 hypothetical protein HELRODRAFT_62927 [Helobdella robusta]
MEIEGVDNSALNSFREYLRIKTVQPEPDYDSAVSFLKKYAAELKLPLKTFEYVERKPIVLITCPGMDTSATSIILNSHMDVVPVFREHWLYDPFEAVMDSERNIFGRGTQDMKSIGIQYLEALKRLLRDGKKFKRTIHLLFVPDEEIGGRDGMKLFVKSDDFKKLNVGFALDEGLPSETDHFKVYYAERTIWQIEVTCTGNPGHGSMFIEDSAAEKLRSIINSFLDFREKEKERKEKCCLTQGDVTSVNLTILQGGVQVNVVPDKFVACFDVRVPPSVDLEEFERTISAWIQRAGKGTSFRLMQDYTKSNYTDIANLDPFWKSLTQTFSELALKTDVEIFPGGTDSRYIREAGIPAIGFSPINKTKQLLHDHNEYLNAGTFLKGIEIYEYIIYNLGNC